MVIPNPAIKFTYRDYLHTPDDRRYELVDGDLILTPAPRRDHQTAQGNLGTALLTFVRDRQLGVVYFAPRDVVLSDHDVVQPDLMFISNQRLHIDTENEVWGAPDLVVEVLSPSTSDRDRTYKRALYARHGVKEYWMVDPDEMSVVVLLLADHGYELSASYGIGDALTAPTLPGFSISLDQIF